MRYGRPCILGKGIIVVPAGVRVVLLIQHLVRAQQLKPSGFSRRCISELLLLYRLVSPPTYSQAMMHGELKRSQQQLTSSSSFARCLSFSALSASSRLSWNSFFRCSSNALAFACLYCSLAYLAKWRQVKNSRRTCWHEPVVLYERGQARSRRARSQLARYYKRLTIHHSEDDMRFGSKVQSGGQV